MLLAELRRISSKGRKQLVDEWAPYLPNYGEFSAPHRITAESNTPATTTSSSNVSGSNIALASSQNVHSSEETSQVKEEEHSSEEEEDHNPEG